MTTVARTSSPICTAEILWESRYIRFEEEPPEGEPDAKPEVWYLKVWDCVVYVSWPTGARVRFRVNYRPGRHLTVTDPRDRLTGTAGTTGIWGTRPAPRASRPHSMTLPGFQFELAPLIGAERAEEIIRSIREEFLDIIYGKDQRLIPCSERVS